MTKSFLTMLTLVCVFFILSCGKDEDTKIDCSGVSPKYSNEVSPILNVSCAFAGCHDAVTKSAGVNLSSYSASVAATKSEKFLKSIKHESGASAMPQGQNKLDNATIKILECWIQNGTPQ